MKTTIRKGLKKDLPSVLKLIQELADYEKASDQVSISLQDLEADGFGEKSLYEFLVAQQNGEIIGLSFYYTRYSTWKGAFLFLEDFIIKQSHRRKGVGALLFEATIKVCHAENYKAMCWQVLDWNTPAINFYKKYGAEISSEWLNGKLTKEQVSNMHSLL